jgi:CRISPR-associated exonuclease Cas4
MCDWVNGVQINYYFICKTKLWLFSHHIKMEQESDNVSLGKILHETTYKKEKEFLIDNNINIDFIHKNKNLLEIHEIKKSNKMEKPDKYQLLYYLYYLKEVKEVKNTIGYLDYPSIKKRTKIKLTPEYENELKKIIKEINTINSKPMEKPKKSKICLKCSYFEFCFS